MPSYTLLIFAVAAACEVGSLPSHYQKHKDLSPVASRQALDLTHNSILISRRKKTIPYQILVPNLHVIPISQHQVHADNVNNMPQNVTQQLIPVLIPFHNYVPVHDLTVIPLHRVAERNSGYRANDDDVYRNPLGGYGVGWTFGGHGAGHGYHYTYYY